MFTYLSAKKGENERRMGHVIAIGDLELALPFSQTFFVIFRQRHEK